MKPEDIVQRVWRYHLLMFVLHAVGLVVCFALTVWPIYGMLFALTANTDMFWISVGVAAVLLVLGLLSKQESSSYHKSSFCPDVDATSGNPTSASGFMLGRQIHRITGPAYIFSQIVYSTAMRLREAIAHFRSWRLTQDIDPRELGDLMSQLRFDPGQRRYHKASTISTCPKLLARAVALEIVLQQQENGEILVGLNSDYD
ncbi:MAG: hypothetical protein QGG42_13885 [Phycisphaerae bacterium]|jgi:hypothetical protein|nr:hypothetical protein [Phycisphaerae bacterium]